MTKEQSAIDAIYTLLEKLETVEQKIDQLDQNVKLINNKLNSFKPKQQVKASVPGSRTAKTVAKTSPSPAAKSVNNEPKLVLGNITVFGEIKTKDGQDIKDVLVNIYSEDNELLKSTRSGKGGYWETRLPPGRYGVEYIHDRFKPVNSVIEVDNSTKRYRVA